jgi:subtilisin family serine protease
MAVLSVMTIFASTPVLAGPQSLNRTFQNVTPGASYKPLLGAPQEKARYHPTRVLVAFRNANAASVFAPQMYGLKVNESVRSRYFTCFDVAVPGQTVDSAVQELRRNPNVRVAEPDFYYSIAGPNDPLFGDLWGLKNTGQLGGVRGADVDIINAWKYTKGKPAIRVAVIDTGVDYNHEDLSANVLRKNGVVVGYDFANNDSDPMDENGHGTHCSGTIAGISGNAKGVAGVAPKVKIMPMRFLDANGNGTTDAAIQAIDWAREHGAKVMSNSWVGGAFSQLLIDAIQRASDENIIFLAAAGNNGINVDVTPLYPAAYNGIVPNILSIAATDRNDTIASFSNYGSTVDVAGPGVDVLSTTPNNTYSWYSGTSMATPHISGIAALVESEYPGISVADVKARIVNGADYIPGLAGLTKMGGRANAANALETDTTPPAVLPDLHISQKSSSAIAYELTASGDDGNTGNVAYFDVRYSYNTITLANFANAAKVVPTATNVPAGTVVSSAITGLYTSVANKIYLAARAIDNVGNAGPILIATPVRLVPPLWNDNAETNAKWTSASFGLDSSYHMSGATSWADSPGATYVSNTDVTMTQAAPVAATGPMLVYANLNRQIENNYDFLYLNVSYDNGVTWSTLRQWTGFSNGWEKVGFYLPSASGDNVLLQWHMTSDSSVEYDGVFIDDVKFAPAATVFTDTVEGADKFNGAGGFAKTNEDSFSPTMSWTDSPGADYANFADATLTSKHAVNATSILPALLTFRANTAIESGYDFVTVGVSDSGPSFRPVALITGTAGWTQYSADASSGSRVFKSQFHFTSDLSVVYDGIHIDDVKVVGEAAVAP